MFAVSRAVLSRTAAVAGLSIPSVTPLLDETTVSCVGAYSFRRLRAAYSGQCFRVRRSSDNTEQDIGFDASGYADTAALLSFIGGGNGFVRTWYDQSGTANNIAQTTNANQPVVVSGGSLVANSKGFLCIRDGYLENSYAMTSELVSTYAALELIGSGFTGMLMRFGTAGISTNPNAGWGFGIGNADTDTSGLNAITLYEWAAFLQHTGISFTASDINTLHHYFHRDVPAGENRTAAIINNSVLSQRLTTGSNIRFPPSANMGVMNTPGGGRQFAGRLSEIAFFSALYRDNETGGILYDNVRQFWQLSAANIAYDSFAKLAGIDMADTELISGGNWSSIAGATSQTLTLTSDLLGKHVRLNAIYTDSASNAENIVSQPTKLITSSTAIPESVFSTALIPANLNNTDGSGSAGDYELGMKFQALRAGRITAIRYYKAASETGTHVGRIWNSTGTLLTSVTFTGETSSGWQQQALATPLAVQANTTYVVSVNVNTHYVMTSSGLANQINNGRFLITVADGSNGILNATPGSFPTSTFSNSNYFRDVVFNANNVGTVQIQGVPAPSNTLTAVVSDADGLSGVTISYQWQQSTDSVTWTNISGATASTLALDSSRLNQRVRVNATYTDALGYSENLISLPTSLVLAPSTTQTIFGSAATPVNLDSTDGSGSAGDYELGMKFQCARAGQINAIRYYKATSETGTHVGRIWSSTGTLLTSVTFAGETASGWQQQALATPLTIEPNTTYVVSVNVNTYYVFTSQGLANRIFNRDLVTVADGNNGAFNNTPGSFPTTSSSNSNYFRDVVFTPSVANNPGTAFISGNPVSGEVLTANIADLDGIGGSVSYQWQQGDEARVWTSSITPFSATAIWEISGNRARARQTGTQNASSGDRACWLTTNVGRTTYRVSARIAWQNIVNTRNDQQGIVFRWADANNNWYFRFLSDNTPRLELVETSAGVPSIRWTQNYNPTNGLTELITVEVTSSTIVVLKNGIRLTSFSSTANNTNTSCGLMAYFGTPTSQETGGFDDFRVVPM